VRFALSFASGFIGTRNTYMMVSGGAGATVWQPEGTWTVGTPQIPTNVSVTPGSGSGSSQVFTATYSDTRGFVDISEAKFMVARDVSRVGGCFARWVPGSKAFYLGNDAATTW
jgi:hypothetical protein